MFLYIVLTITIFSSTHGMFVTSQGERYLLRRLYIKRKYKSITTLINQLNTTVEKRQRFAGKYSV